MSRPLKAKKYYTLACYFSGRWFQDFGDYDRGVVNQERLDRSQAGEYKLKDMMVITTDDNPAAIEAAIAKLNN